MSLNKNKIRQCIEDIIRQYNYSRKIPNFVNVNFVSETNGKFIQIVIKLLIDDIWFVEPTYVPMFGYLGTSIAQGEKKFFIQKVLESVTEVKRISVSKFSFSFLIENILPEYYVDDFVLLVPIEILYNLMLMNRAEWPVSYNYEMNSFILSYSDSKIPIYSIHKDLIKSYILGIRKDFGLWSYKEFPNRYKPSIKETIMVEIQRSNEIPTKVELLVRSLINFEIFNINSIKAVEIC